MVGAKNLVVVAWAILLLSGCASYSDQVKDIRAKYQSGAYDLALQKLESSDIKEQPRNRLLFNLEKAMILDRLGQVKKSQNLLIAADKLVDQLYRASIAGEVASYLYNDSTTDYQGEDYEKVAIHTILALSFLGEGALQEARVEARASNERLEEINGAYDENKNHYAEDAFAQYLGGMVFEAKKEWDSAIISYGRALTAYESTYGKFFRTAVPPSLIQGYYRVAKIRKRKKILQELEENYSKLSLPKDASVDDSFIIGLHQAGVVAPKTQGNFVSLWDGKPIRFSFPQIRYRNPATLSNSGIYLNGKYHGGDLTQDMTAIAAQTLDDARARYFVKSIARLIVKDQVAQQARKSGGGFAELIVALYGAITETADTRSWSFLPAAFFVTRLPVEPGEYTVRLESNDRSGGFEPVKIGAGEMRFIRHAG